MRKAFNKEDTDLLEIKPIEDAVVEPVKVSPGGLDNIKKISYKQNEVFDEPTKSDPMTNDSITNDDEVSLVVEDGDETKPKRGRGKRGKDKKPRVKKPPTEKQLAHLKKMREASRLKREAKNIEKERIKKDTEKKAIIAVDPKPKPVPIQQTPGPSSTEQFFKMMEKYEEYKEKRNRVKKTKAVEQPPAIRANSKEELPKKPFHNPLKNEPQVETNPYDQCFKY